MRKFCCLLSIILGFAFLFGFEWYFHGYYLAAAYLDTTALWRPESQMQSFFPYMLISQIGFVVFFMFLYKCSSKASGLASGLKFGTIAGLMLAFLAFGAYAYMPLPLNLALHWAAGALIEALGLGIIAGLFCKKCQ